jgi:Arc/MetJ family transcription regulator
MRVELEIDDELLRRALVVTKETSAADAIRHAVKEFVRVEAASGIRKMLGKMEFDPGYLAERERDHPGSV